MSIFAVSFCKLVPVNTEREIHMHTEREESENGVTLILHVLRDMLTLKS